MPEDSIRQFFDQIKFILIPYFNLCQSVVLDSVDIGSYPFLLNVIYLIKTNQ